MYANLLVRPNNNRYLRASPDPSFKAPFHSDRQLVLNTIFLLKQSSSWYSYVPDELFIYAWKQQWILTKKYIHCVLTRTRVSVHTVSLFSKATQPYFLNLVFLIKVRILNAGFVLSNWKRTASVTFQLIKKEVYFHKKSRDKTTPYLVRCKVAGVPNRNTPFCTIYI